MLQRYGAGACDVIPMRNLESEIPEGAFAEMDRGIVFAVRILDAAGVETFQSCEGGAGHAFPEPTVQFHGTQQDAWRALAAALDYGLPVSELRRFWSIERGEPHGPYFALTFTRAFSERADARAIFRYTYQAQEAAKESAPSPPASLPEEIQP